MGNYKSYSLIGRYLPFLRNYNFSDKLPSLTSSPLVDVELYSIIAIICRDHVNIWYEQMTHDKNFVEELLFLISHIVKELEKRFFMIKHDILLLDSIPMIAIKHINIRRAEKIILTNINSRKTFDDIFRGFQLHTALDSHESEHLYLRLVADSLITSLLPSNDLKSECERVIIREILSDFVLKKIIDKLSEPSILFEIITKLIINLKKKSIKTKKSRFFNMFILIKLHNFMLFLWKNLFMSIINPPQFEVLNIFDLAGFNFIFEILELKTESPYIYVFIRFFLIPCFFVFIGDMISIKFSEFWNQHIFTEDLAIRCFRSLRILIGSNNSSDASKIQYCKYDNYEIKEKLVLEIYTSIPVSFRKLFFGSNEAFKNKIKRIFSLFDSKLANKHFIIYILDLIVRNIVYELSDTTPERIYIQRII
ncbi:uncharacterized protein T551_00257 [Pneumocystis jirovecii RU7]|uniref:PXA domain-containing protein n=1 Tax=Pneumocystis jirovecii (strain RU7) TaxID=1408657 RepID=A0A0W4ZWN3_PNEJ7|nr:uncharacterized protein T551_00257 [Pneumocystis jirovecii RU7]KTW32772.1 hypothetical protein T551_00257 [Pneumocystis jirovecii RU7]